MKKRNKFYRKISILGRWVFFLVMVLLFGTQSAYSQTLDEQVADAIAGGQNFLFNSFVDVEGTGYYSSSQGYPIAATAASVSALIETGAYSDPDIKAQVDKAVAYLVANQNADGSFGFESTYETGMTLVALSLYHSQNPQDASFITDVIQPAVDYFLTGQYEGGAWSYSTCGEFCTGDSGDLSNTQFAIMGLWYAFQYVLEEQLPTDPESWAGRLESWVRLTQNENGCFTYTQYKSSFVAAPMNGAGLWALAMLGVDQTDAAVQDSLAWFNDYYAWAYTAGYQEGSYNAYYYGIYAMAKGLTGMIPATYQFNASDNDWVTDLKQAMMDKKIAEGDSYYWYLGGSLDTDETMSTAFVLMSLSFADPGTESPTKRLPDTEDPDYPIKGKGFVTLEATDGVTISYASRKNIVQVDTGKIVLPIGATSFTLNNVPVGGTATLKIIPPQDAFDAGTANSFVNEDGSIREWLHYFKFVDGEWKGINAVKIQAMPVGGPYTYIEVTLQDGGLEDADGQEDGKIEDPAAAGFFNEEPVAADFVDGGGLAGSGSSGPCFIGTLLF